MQPGEARRHPFRGFGISGSAERKQPPEGKACENCMERLNGALSEEQMQQFREAFYTASEGHLFRESIPGQK